jgi:hypothetical protein
VTITVIIIIITIVVFVTDRKIANVTRMFEFKSKSVVVSCYVTYKGTVSGTRLKEMPTTGPCPEADQFGNIIITSFRRFLQSLPVMLDLSFNRL